MDPFRLCLALGPVAIYLLLLGLVNLGRRPLVVSGVRDATALGLALAGLVIVGPLELFFPHEAASRFGPYVWLLVLTLYGLGLILTLLLLRPRLVIYNISLDQLRPVLGELVEQLDGDRRWAGDSLVLPTLGVQLHVDSFAAMKNVSLTSIGGLQNHAGWRRLELALAAALRRIEVSRNPRGISLVTGGALVLALLCRAIYQQPDVMTQQLTAVFDIVKQMLAIK